MSRQLLEDLTVSTSDEEFQTDEAQSDTPWKVAGVLQGEKTGIVLKRMAPKTKTPKTPAHRCNLCGRTCRDPTMLREHLRRHTGEKPFHCTQCPQKFTTKRNLKEHTKNQHSNPNRVQCSQCPKTFSTQQNKASHERAAHTDSSFTCSVCGAVYKYKNKLTAHFKSKHS